MKALSTAAGLAVALVLLSAPASASNNVTVPGIQTGNNMPQYKVVGDAYVVSNEPNRNCASDPVLRVGSSGPAEHISYIQYDLSAVPLHSRVDGAELWLYCSEVTGEHGVTRVSRVLDPWTEFSLTFGNRPGSDVSMSFAEISEPGWYRWDVTEIVGLWLDGVDNHGFCIDQVDGRPQELSFASREGGVEFWPRIAISFHREDGPQGGSDVRGGRLLGAGPNPVRGRADIRFSLAAAGPVSVQIYAADGRLVRSLVSGSRAAGDHRVALDARGLSNGAYSVRMVAGDIVSTIPLVKAE